MNLIYPPKWKFEGNGISLSRAAANEFQEILLKIANGRKDTIEDFKQIFGAEGGSSSYSWALTDLDTAIQSSTTNAPLFIEMFWNCVVLAASKGEPTPDAQYINSILNKNAIPLVLNPPNLELASDSTVTESHNASPGQNSVSSFTLKDKIGEGGFGVVYKAIRSTSIDDFEYALKFLDPMPFNINCDEAFKRFQREVKIIRSLQHKSIIYYYEAGVTPDKKPYLVMQHIDGENLRIAMSSAGLIGGLFMFIEVLEALEYAHSKGVIHRDLKPSNIIVRSTDKQPIILDFGSAYVLDEMDSRTLTTHQVGTYGYIPSEILSQPKLRSPLQDIYACGMMLYESFAGHRPDPANYIPLSEHQSEYSILDPIIKDAIAGHAQRINSARIFCDRIKAAVQLLQRNTGITETQFQIQSTLDHVQQEFSEYDLMAYRTFSDSLYNCYSKIRNDATFITSYDHVIKSLQELYNDVCLDIFISDIPQLTRCFVSGSHYYKECQIYVSDLKSFIELLQNSTPQKQNLILRNIAAKIKRVKTYSPPNDDDLPF